MRHFGGLLDYKSNFIDGGKALQNLYFVVHFSISDIVKICGMKMQLVFKKFENNIYIFTQNKPILIYKLLYAHAKIKTEFAKFSWSSKCPW